MEKYFKWSEKLVRIPFLAKSLTLASVVNIERKQLLGMSKARLSHDFMWPHYKVSSNCPSRRVKVNSYYGWSYLRVRSKSGKHKDEASVLILRRESEIGKSGLLHCIYITEFRKSCLYLLGWIQIFNKKSSQLYSEGMSYILFIHWIEYDEFVIALLVTLVLEIISFL